MNRKIIKCSITVLACLAVLYPLWMRAKDLIWSFDSTLLFNLFPMFGLLAFSLLWLHSISGVFEPWLRKYISFDKFVHRTSLLILISLILHPLLLFIASDFNLGIILGSAYIRLGIIGWFLLITYDISKVLKKYDFFVRNWNKILLISTAGFILTFLHSLVLGSNLQSGPLRAIWIFYGTTAIIATVYTYGVKRFFK